MNMSKKLDGIERERERERVVCERENVNSDK